MTIQQLYDALEARIPRSLSCGWDNDGLSCCPDPAAPVRGVLVALDATDDAVAAAERRGCNLLVTHHPLLFRGLRAVDGVDDRLIVSGRQRVAQVISDESSLAPSGLSCAHPD